MNYILVGIAGSVGAVLRYAIGVFFFTDSAFPFATLSINLIGSYLLAWFTTNLFQRISITPHLATAISTGFVGSFTTFSTLSVETVELFQHGHLLLGVLYLLLSIVGGLALCRLGWKKKKEGHVS